MRLYAFSQQIGVIVWCGCTGSPNSIDHFAGLLPGALPLGIPLGRSLGHALLKIGLLGCGKLPRYVSTPKRIQSRPPVSKSPGWNAVRIAHVPAIFTGAALAWVSFEAMDAAIHDDALRSL